MSERKALMCRPTWFEIEFSINPWMDTGNRVDKGRADAQWTAVYEALTGLGVEVDLIDPVQGLADMTFAGDCGLASGKRFLASNFRHPERQGEREHYVRWFEGQGYEIIHLPEEVWFEGLGDVIVSGDDVVFGYGHRSSEEALRYIREAFPNLNVRANLELADERFYHVGLGLSMLDKDRVLYYPHAFSAESQEAICRTFMHPIAVEETDAMTHFACNNLVVSGRVLLAGCSSELERELNRQEYEVLKLEMSEFKKSGASLRCLVLDL